MESLSHLLPAEVSPSSKAREGSCPGLEPQTCQEHGGEHDPSLSAGQVLDSDTSRGRKVF
jgi:hypothetical protein